jgi:GNAT superfamily N-acetyltransferase
VIEVREPTRLDADALGRMHYQAWVEAYTPLLPPAFWGPATEQRWVERWRHNLSMRGEGITNRIALRDGTVIGMATTGPARANTTAGAPARDLELYSIYVLASEYGTGLADRLLADVLAPETPAEVWVFEANARARGFYSRHGFEPDGASHVFGQELANQPEIRMVR